MTNTEKLIEIKTEDGKTLQGEILFSFEANGDDFVLYEIDGNVFAAKYDESNNLNQIEEDEWPLVEKIFEQYIEENDMGEEYE